MKKLITICAVIMLFNTSYVRASTWTTLDYPGAIQTEASGIFGNNIVGSSSYGGNSFGFIYNGTSWSDPYHGYIKGISGNTFVGYYEIHFSTIHGFVDNGVTWTELDYLGASNTVAMGINGGNIVGYYNDSGGVHSFLYNGGNWTTLNAPGATSTYAYGISGDNIVGEYIVGEYDGHGFIFNIPTQSWTTIYAPGAPELRTIIRGIDGSNIVGSYYDDFGSHGFLYNGTTWTTLDAPGTSGSTHASGISGGKIVGDYFVCLDHTNYTHGFVYEIPEPATLLLLGFGAFAIASRRPVSSKQSEDGSP